jgi:nitrogen fixation protein NifQ
MMRGRNEQRVYTRLTGQGVAHGSDPFDLHILACIISLAAQEAEEEGIGLAQGLGLEGWELRALFLDQFPGAVGLLEGWTLECGDVANDESALRDILWFHSAGTGTLSRALVKMVARRCQRPNHLWQDLGLGSRRELSALVNRHFPKLAERNSHDMKWKKYFYRMICSATGFSLCVAPVCSECDDFDDCFGAEDGESLLARVGNGRGKAAPAQMSAPASAQAEA